METILILILLIITYLIFKNFDILKIILNYVKDLILRK